MPWPVTAPFRMRPNLEKLDADAPALLLRDELVDVYRKERVRVLAAHPERAIVGAQNEQALAAIQSLAPSPRVGQSWGEGGGCSSNNRGFPLKHTPLPSPLPQGERGQDVALSLQEDFVILKQETDALRTEYLSVCFPSRWDPREKLGLDFAAIHAPVADNQTLLAAGQSIMTMAFIKQPMLRHVWLIVPSASLDQHPDKNEAWWSETLRDMSPLLPNLYFRVERQTTWQLPHLQRAVFLIRVMMSPLVEVLREPLSIRPNGVVGPGDVIATRAQALAASLRSMTPEVVAYRGMTDAMPRLLAELDHFE